MKWSYEEECGLGCGWVEQSSDESSSLPIISTDLLATHCRQ